MADRLIGLKGVQHGRLVKTVPAHPLDAGKKTAHKHTHKLLSDDAQATSVISGIPVLRPAGLDL